jgi:outer membrane protein assembly factor BamB
VSSRDRFADMTLTPTGDVIVGARIGDRIVVLALRGTDGTERWRSSTEPIGEYESANGVAVTPDGDVVVAGDTSAPGAVVARLDGSTGATRWTRSFPHLGDPHGLAVDGDGTVLFGAYFAVGRSLFDPTSFTVVLLGASGDPIWERRIEPTDGKSPSGYVSATTFLPGGDVAATGSVDDDTVTVRLARTTGDVLWRHDLDGAPGRLARTPDGDLLVSAGVFNGRTCWDFVLLDLSSATGTERGRRRMRGRAANDHSGCSSGVNDDGLGALAVSDLGVAIAASVGDTRGKRRLIARFPLAR